MRPSAPVAPDHDLDSWLKWAGTMYLVLVVGFQLVAEQPGPGLFFVSLFFCALPAAVGGAIFMSIWKAIKIIFE